MGGNLSKKTPNQHLAHGAPVDDDGAGSAIDLTQANFRRAFQSQLSFNTLIDFTGLPLEMDDKVANTMLESKSVLCRDKIFSSTFQEYFNLTSNELESFSLSTLHVPTSNEDEEEEGHQLKNLPNDFIEKYHSLEKRLQTYESKISPKMRTYGMLQVAARMLVMLSTIGPITWALLVGEKLHVAVVAAVVSLTFIAFGVTGKWACFFCERKKQELQVKETIIRLMLISINLQKKSLNRISGLIFNGGMLVQEYDVIRKAVDDLHHVIRNDRKIILQKLSEYRSSSGGNTLEELV